jgi:hypothetical protein
VDDLEHVSTIEVETWFEARIVEEFGPCKSQSGSWVHVGSEHEQNKAMTRIFVHQKSFGQKLTFIILEKEEQVGVGEPQGAQGLPEQRRKSGLVLAPAD